MPLNTLQVHTEYVLVKSMVPFLNCGGGDRWCHHLSQILSSLREFYGPKSYCHLYRVEGEGQRQALAMMSSVGLDLITSDRWHEQQQHINGYLHIT
ncbi:hypothetical protein TNCV_1819231 [Trichonephila clavipes]|nr:hypothetical protein TNCV_1819231 [Trichonephila clavipes]